MAPFIYLNYREVNFDINNDFRYFFKIRNPKKTSIPSPVNDGCACNECPHMHLNTLGKMVGALEKIKPEITLHEDLRIHALIPLEKMVALS